MVVAVWLVAIGLLMRREFGGSLFQGDAAGGEPGFGEVAYAVLIPGAAEADVDRSDGQRAEQRVGAVRMDRQAETRHGFPGATARVDARMALRLLGKQTELAVEGDVWRPDDPEAAGKQLELDFRVVSQGHDFRLVAELAGGRLTGEVRSAGESLPLDLPVGDDVLVESGLGASLRFPQMAVGETLRFASFDPLTLSQGRAKVTCVAEETLVLSGRSVVAKRLEVEASGIDTLAWIDEAGEVLRAETPLGIVLERLPDGASLGLTESETAEAGNSVGDFLGQTSVRPTGTPPTRGASRLVLRLSGADLEPPTDVAQRLVDRSPTGTVLEIVRDVSDSQNAGESPQLEHLPEHLAADAFVQSGHAEIQERASTIVGDETDAWRRAELLHDWVFERIDKEPVVSIPSALEVLRQRRGDCNEHTVLYAALARSLGIPTRIAIGLVWSDELDGFYYHAWPEVFVEPSAGDGTWVRVDPTLGQPVADATHVKLLEGGIETWPRLLGYLGKLEIEVLEMTAPEMTAPEMTAP